MQTETRKVNEITKAMHYIFFPANLYFVISGLCMHVWKFHTVMLKILPLRCLYIFFTFEGLDSHKSENEAYLCVRYPELYLDTYSSTKKKHIINY